MKTIYTFTLDDEGSPSEYYGDNLRLFAYLLYDKLYNYDGEGFTPLNINKNIVYNNIHCGSNDRKYFLDSDIYDDGYINYEPFLIGKHSFALTIDDDSMNLEILQSLITEVLFISKLNYRITIRTIPYSSKNKNDELNRRRAICQAYESLGCELPTRKVNLKAIYQMYESILCDAFPKKSSYSRKKVVSSNGFQSIMNVSGR